MDKRHSAQERTKVTFDCSLEEKTYIKMLAARANMTLGEFVLSYLRADFPSKKKRANKTTLAAHKEALEGKGTSYKTMDDFWADMGVGPHVKA